MQSVSAQIYILGLKNLLFLSHDVDMKMGSGSKVLFAS